MVLNKIEYLPTPKEIAKATAKIRAGWSDMTRRKRDGSSKDKKDKDYVPVVRRFYGRRDGSIGMETIEGLSIEVG